MLRILSVILSVFSVGVYANSSPSLPIDKAPKAQICDASEDSIDEDKDEDIIIMDDEESSEDEEVTS